MYCNQLYVFHHLKKLPILDESKPQYITPLQWRHSFKTIRRRGVPGHTAPCPPLH